MVESNPSSAQLTQYAVVADRRLQWDVLLWQVPSLAFAAESFILTLTVASTVSWSSRVCLNALGLCIAFLCCNLMARIRGLSVTDAAWLDLAEKEYGISAKSVVPPPFGSAYRAYHRHRIGNGVGCGKLMDPLVSRVARIPSFRVWFLALLAFGLIHLTLLTISIMGLANS